MPYKHSCQLSRLPTCLLPPSGCPQTTNGLAPIPRTQGLLISQSGPPPQCPVLTSRQRLSPPGSGRCAPPIKNWMVGDWHRPRLAVAGVSPTSYSRIARAMQLGCHRPCISLIHGSAPLPRGCQKPPPPPWSSAALARRVHDGQGGGGGAGGVRAGDAKLSKPSVGPASPPSASPE